MPEHHRPAERAAAPGPSRRVVAGALASLPVVLLTGCGVRLEDDAPRLPGVPTRTATPGEDALLQAWADATALLRTATALGAPGAAAARLHTTHAATFDQDLRDRRVPESRRRAASGTAAAGGASPSTASSTASGAPTTGTTGGGSTPALSPTQALAARELAVCTAGRQAALGRVPAERVAMLASFTVCCARLGAGLGRPTAWTDPVATPTPADPALLRAHRRARYFLEVAAARTPAAARGRVLDELHRVDAAVLRLESRAQEGGQTDAAPAGYPLPFRVADPAAATRLVAWALGDLELGCGRAWQDAAGSIEAVAAVDHALDDTLAAGARWGLPLRAFPGLAS